MISLPLQGVRDHDLYPGRACPLRRDSFLLILLLPLFLASAALADDAEFAPVFEPEMNTAVASGAIDIDGRLGDPGWESAGIVQRFVERSPGENIPPLVETTAYVTYDEDRLYVAFVCRDDPDAIRASLTQRDQFGDDDLVGILIDTYGEAQWAYEFFVNPYGVQMDMMWTSVHGEDIGFDLVWDSAAQIDEDGWTVEMAIPFAGLRFPRRPAADLARGPGPQPPARQRPPLRVVAPPDRNEPVLALPVGHRPRHRRHPTGPRHRVAALVHRLPDGRALGRAGRRLGLRQQGHQGRALAGREVLALVRGHDRGDAEPGLQPDRIGRRPDRRQLHDLPALSRATSVLPGGQRPLPHDVQLVLHPHGERPGGGGQGHRALGQDQRGLPVRARRDLTLHHPHRGTQLPRRSGRIQRAHPARHSRASAGARRSAS